MSSVLSSFILRSAHGPLSSFCSNHPFKSFVDGQVCSSVRSHSGHRSLSPQIAKSNPSPSQPSCLISFPHIVTSPYNLTPSSSPRQSTLVTSSPGATQVFISREGSTLWPVPTQLLYLNTGLSIKTESDGTVGENSWKKLSR